MLHRGGAVLRTRATQNSTTGGDNINEDTAPIAHSITLLRELARRDVVKAESLRPRHTHEQNPPHQSSVAVARRSFVAIRSRLARPNPRPESTFIHFRKNRGQSMRSNRLRNYIAVAAILTGASSAYAEGTDESDADPAE